MTRGGFLRLFIGLAVSAACIAFLVSIVRGENVGQSLAAGNPAVLLPAVVLYFAGTTIRSLRWRYLLGGKPSVLLLFRTLVIGLMLNDLLPGRLGEVARVYLLARNASIPVGASLASIVVERVLDGIALITLLGLGLVVAVATGSYRAEAFGGVLVAVAIVGPIFVAATAVLLWAARWPAGARQLGHLVVRPAPLRPRERLDRLVDGTVAGLAPIASGATGLTVFLLSLLAWLIEASMYFVIMTGFHVIGGLAAAALGTAVANLATLVPSSPGYIGTFDLALRQVLVGVFGNAGEEADGFTIVVHLALIVPVVVVGLFFVWREDLSLPELRRRV
ncbi:MAG: glycosyltransferase 2 family protein [Chloroflexota bacterium]|jgi:uncharacterized protein (TIRG00374 family)|nr:glycosyltransferase 2 family protein [Chloroflexota bacterium]